MKRIGLNRYKSAALFAGVMLFTGLAWSTDLRTDFMDPPSSAHPKVLWKWMNGNVSPEGITTDLEAMKRTGVGGVLIHEVSNGIPAGPVIPGTDLWKERMIFAAKEANRLGLTFGLHQSPGWSGSGGPWISPEHSMQVLTFSETRVKGGDPADQLLPQPVCRENWYRDIAVFAFRAAPNDVDPEPGSFRAITGAGAAGNAAIDGDFHTTLLLDPPSKDNPPMLTLSFDESFTARSLTVNSHRWQTLRAELQVSDEGRTFHKACDVDFPRGRPVPYPYCFNIPAVTAKHFRLVFNNPEGAGDGKVEIGEFRLHGGNRLNDYYVGTGVVTGQINGAFEMPDEDIVPAESVVDLTAQMDSQGLLHWNAPDGEWIVVRMGHTSTGSAGREAPDGADGLQCDKLSKEALELHWNGYMKPLLESAAMKGARIDYIDIDSWEVGTQNWTPGFAEEFRSRRGYNLSKYWPAMTGRVVDNQKETNRFLRDIRRTVADLIADNYFGHMRELAGRQGLKVYAEAYGNANFNFFECAGRADVPMTEFWVDEQQEFHGKFAASPAHIYGSKIVAAEAFTSFTGKTVGRWLETPQTMKATADNIAFCGGINMLVFHRFAHNPWPNIKPGMTMGPYGTHFDGTLTWWEQGRAWLSYLSRCQHLLQQGQFCADVLYFGDLEWGAMGLRKHLQPLVPEGYDYDGCSADALMLMSVEDGQIVLPSGMRYRYLVLQDSWQMDLDVLEKIRDLLADGATVIGDRPRVAPGLGGYPECDVRLNQIAAELWGSDGSVKEKTVGKGRILRGMTLEEIMNADGLAPDFSYSAPDGKRLSYIHRYTDDEEIYFVANPQKEAVTAECVFRVEGMVPELWHPESGKTEPAPVWHEKDGRTVVNLSFDPVGSVFVIFRSPEKEPLHLVECSGGVPSVQEKGIRVDAWSNGTVRARFAGETSLREMKVERVPDPIEIAGPWTVQFDPKWTKPAVGKNGKIIFEQLDDWTQRPEEGIKYYSGTAVYQNTFSVPKAWQKGDRKMVLDLGRVKEMAEVFVNGKPAGILWGKPFEVDVTKWLKAGKNQLEVRVVNLWPNRLIGDEQLLENNGNVNGRWPDSVTKNQTPPGGRLTFTTARHWGKQEQPLSSGLLGPVIVRASEPIEWKEK